MSFTIVVPALVPSDFHNSDPFVPLSAVKYKKFPTAVARNMSAKPHGPMTPKLLHEAPELISFTMYASDPAPMAGVVAINEVTHTDKAMTKDLILFDMNKLAFK
jgi:hypothetical protein